ncbi:MAG TPA: amidase family protein, partial [Pirellulales bacterium]
MSLVDRTAAELLADLNARRVSSVEVVQAYVGQIEKLDSKVKAFLRYDAAAALDQAKAIDDRRAAGKAVGLLAGLPVAVKDLICKQGELTTCASKILATFRPPYDAAIIEKLRAADAVFLGRTNMDEFAMGGSNENSAFFPTRNPWNLECIPGGSSGGAAACVAARMACLSIGTDTGGSIRQPAGLCGVTGMKPTYGRVSRYGLVAFASSLDQIGPLARTAEDAALLLEVIAGHDPRDATSLATSVPQYSQTVKQPLAGLKIGLVREHFGRGLDAEVETAVREAFEVYQSLGATVKELSMPHAKYGVATYYIIAPCEASSNLARYDGVHYGYRTNVAKMNSQLAEETKHLQAARGLANNTANSKAATLELDNPLVRMYR